MKKAFSFASLTLGVLLAALPLAACKTKKFDYYDKTFTYTGSAQAINWDDVDQYDNYVGITDFSTAPKYSNRQLLEKYFDKIDWDNTTIWGVKWSATFAPPATINECIEKINNELVPKIFEAFKGITLNVSGASDLKLTVTYTDATAGYVGLTEDKTIVAKMAETQEQFDAWQLTSEEFNGSLSFDASNAGLALFEYNGIRSVQDFRAYKNSEKMKGFEAGWLKVYASIPTGINEETGGYEFSTSVEISFMEATNAEGFAGELLRLTLSPEFSVTDNA